MNTNQELGRYIKLLSGSATFMADARLTLQRIDEQFCTLCGLSSALCLPGASLAELLPPVLLALVQSPAEFGRTNVLTLGDDDIRYLHATVLPGETNTSQVLLLTDVTGIHERQRTAEEEKQQYKILADISGDIPFEYDAVTDTMSFAPRFEGIFGEAPHIPQFSSYVENLPAEHICAAFRNMLTQTTAPSKSMQEVQARTHDGTICWFFLFCRVSVDETGENLHLMGALRNIDLQKKEQLKLQVQARQDPMTGLLNKQTAEEEIRAALPDARPNALGVLMMLDIDNFKMVNDTMGHLAGDSVIHQVASQLKSLFRKNDILGRVGGDEFQVYMRDMASPSLVAEKAELLCETARKLFTNSNLGHEISLSIGISFTDHAMDYDELFSEADIALYHAKANGKNRFEIFGQSQPNQGQQGLAPSPLTLNAVRNSIMVEIIDLLFSMEDMQEGIEKVLYFIGNALRVDAIFIAEKSIDLERISISHEWVANVEWERKLRCADLPVEAFFQPEPDSAGIFYCSDTTLLPEEERLALEREGITSLLQCSIALDGKCVGYVGFEERGARRIWTQQEVDTLILMSKLISEYIRRRRSSQLLNTTHETTRHILNNLTATVVYVVGKDDRRLLYFNDTLHRMFPDVKLGMTCHEAFWKSARHCDFCPACGLDEADHISTLLYNAPFWAITNITLSPILWESATPAYVAVLSEHIPGSEEQSANKEAFLRALSSNYDDMLAIDPLTGRYELLSSNVSSVSVPKNGDYDACLHQICTAHVEPSYQEEFYQRFSLNGMLRAFADGVREIEMDFERRVGNELRWKQRRAFAYTLPNGERHIIAYNYDVTRQKQEESCFLNVLQSGYSEIYEIDLETDSVTRIHRDENNGQLPPSAFSYAEDVRVLADSVHPDDRDQFLEHYDADHIRKNLAEKKACEIKYRIMGPTSWRHISSRILSLANAPGALVERVLLLRRDITRDHEQASIAQAMEIRFNTFFRLSCDVVLEIDLETLHYQQTVFQKNEHFSTRSSGQYPEGLQAATIESVHPDDLPIIQSVCSPAALRQAFDAGRKEHACQYRVQSPSLGLLWVESRIFYVTEESHPMAFILVRDITRQKQAEEDHLFEERRFNATLRDTYTEIYEIDIEKDKPKLVFSKSDVLIPVDHDPDANIHEIARTLIHPDDQEHFVASFIGTNLQRCFANGHEEVPEEYRRLGGDGRYYWISASLVPLCQELDGNCKKGMLLIKDITEKKKEEQKRRVSAQYDRALRNIYDELYEINVTKNAYRILYHSENKYVLPPEEGVLDEAIALVGNTMIHPDDGAQFQQFFSLPTIQNHFKTKPEYMMGEFRKLLCSGKFRWAALTLFPVTPEEDGDETYLVFIMDIGARKKAEEVVQQNILLQHQRRADERYKTIVKQTETLVFEWYPQQDGRYITPEIPQLFAGNYDERDIVDIWLEDGVIHPNDVTLLEKQLASVRSGQEYSEMTVRLRTRNGAYRWSKIAFAALQDENGQLERIIGTLNDVDDATRAIHALKYRAEFDMLTGIRNAQTFYAEATTLLQQPSERPYYVIRMDVDRFKVINDLYGLEEGDRLLRAIAQLLSEHMTGSAVYGRISGDIFCMCVDYTADEIIAHINDVTKKLAQYPLPYKIAVSFGICKVDNVATPINVLCDWASLALKTVKGNYFKTYAFYDEKLRDRILEEKKIESEMHEALMGGQFVMYLQPKVDIATSRISGAEALVRWQHPTEGLIPPLHFVPLFEKNGFVVRLDEYIWEQACIALRRWLDAGYTPSPISVNVSRLHFHGTRLYDKLMELVTKYSIPPELLELEITETAFLENEQEINNIMRTLQEFGFRFSMDDFGSGYSSLTMLKNLPIDIVKIDRGFLNESVSSDHGQIVIYHTIAMARQMNLKVIAEGVETVEQALFLLRAGCGYAQGFFYSRPVPIADFETLAFGPVDPPFPTPGPIAAHVAETENDQHPTILSPH